MTQRPGTPAQDEWIENIQTLQYLKKFACPKVQHKKDWYTECEKCLGQNSCKTGTRVMKLTGRYSQPKAPEPPRKPEPQKKPEAVYSETDTFRMKTRELVQKVFEQKDPVRYLLEHAESPKPMAVYQKVQSWKNKYPDLEKQYHMMAKVRFLWSDPYDRMSVPDILRELYERKEELQTVQEPEVVVASVMDDDISLEDFLAEIGG